MDWSEDHLINMRGLEGYRVVDAAEEETYLDFELVSSSDED